MNIALVNLEDIKELSYTLDCLEFIDIEIIDAQIDLFTETNLEDAIEKNFIRNIFPLRCKNIRFSDLNLKFTAIRYYAKHYKYDIAVDTECTLKSALITYFLSGRTAGFKEAGFLGYIKSKFYDEVLVVDTKKDKKTLTFELLKKTFGFNVNYK
jgi:ADP-heptose:LPS heptosyltransferase